MASDPTEPTQTILLVEDEPPIRLLMSRMLKGARYRVLEARNGREALDVFRTEGPTIDLLLTDIHLPFIDGQELIKRLRAQRRTLKVVVITGAPLTASADRGVLLSKPFSREALLSTVRDVLDGQGPDQ
jgi:CheY-like chemotaxis protein